MSFKKWPSIDKFSDVYFTANRYNVSNVGYKFKIKLHGTNAGIRIEDGQLFAQKRSGDITVGDDNAGFAAWVNTLNNIAESSEGIIFYGEWAGSGVQTSDAITQIGTKKFFVFAYEDTLLDEYQYEPDVIAARVNAVFGDHPDIYVIPWLYEDTMKLNFLQQESAQEFIDQVMKTVDAIAAEDPYVKQMFNVSGPGEGVVGYPVEIENTGNYLFKAKSEAHTINKSKVRNHVAPEKPAGVDEFVDMFFTEGRFDQMLNEHLNGVADIKKTGDFLKAVMSDVYKESTHELELAEFDWKVASKYGITKTKSWFMNKATSIS